MKVAEFKNSFQERSIKPLQDALGSGQLTEETESTGRPVFIYLTTSDPKKAKKLKNWEEAQLSKDELIIGVKVFHCIMADVESLEAESPLGQLLGKTRAPGFYTMHNGKLLYRAEGMPKSGIVFSCMKKTISKVYKVRLDKVVKQVQGIEKTIEKLENRKTLCQQKLGRTKDKDRGRQKILDEIDALAVQVNQLNAEIDNITDLEALKKEALASRKVSKR